MKKILSFILLMLFSGVVMSQGILSAAATKRAQKKAMAEAKMYHKKGFKPYHTKQSIQAMLFDYYKLAYTEKKPGIRVYVQGQGMSTGKDTPAAIAHGIQDANKSIPGLLSMYFNSWASVDSRTTDKEKSKITDAVNTVAKSFKNQLPHLKYYKIYEMVRPKKGKYQSIVRILYNQEMLRTNFRRFIKKELQHTTQWNEKRIDALLHFEP